jgi:hypothetical protein
MTCVILGEAPVGQLYMAEFSDESTVMTDIIYTPVLVARRYFFTNLIKSFKEIGFSIYSSALSNDSPVLY